MTASNDQVLEYDITFKVNRKAIRALVKRVDDIRVRAQAEVDAAIEQAAKDVFVMKAGKVRAKRKPKGRK